MSDHRPLAERMRPLSLNDYVGQKHLLGNNSSLKISIDTGILPSMILWGPPGVGKTTLAKIIAKSIDTEFFILSAISSGVKDIREVIDRAKEYNNSIFSRNRAILFIDEIHRFSKNQQDALLPWVENGTFTLIGATTENPSFEIITALLSRCQVYRLYPLDSNDILELINRVIKEDWLFKNRIVDIVETDALVHFSSGDARRALNILELIATSTSKENITINNEIVHSLVQDNLIAFDKGGELHYDLASAFIKSIRGSDPDAAIYYLARLIAGGEDPNFIARRLVISAAEDIGLANPNALLLAEATAQAVSRLGMPEGRIPLAQTTIYLATCEKSNTAYNAINTALDFVKNTGNIPVPLHLRNAVTDLMKNMGYASEYMYPHNYSSHFVPQEYFPDNISGTKFYTPSGDNPIERQIKDRQERRWANGTNKSNKD